ncbi:MAG: Asp23/Gls24 family envelope stress response protein [Firmicutes bacterium]|nr:Asp23/Gls24 family envelope stress response protein [Bacillota bacterium]
MPYKTTDKKSGDTVYGRKVINSIILLATKEIPGVASLHGRGFRTEFNSMMVDVDVYIHVDLNVSCADVAYRVQENIKRNVESMSAFKIGIVNVNILGVIFNDEKIKV